MYQSNEITPILPLQKDYYTILCETELVNESMVNTFDNNNDEPVRYMSMDDMNSTFNDINILYASKKRILGPLNCLQCLIGWTPYLLKGQEQMVTNSHFVFGLLYLFFFITTLLFSYVHQVVHCIPLVNLTSLDKGNLSNTNDFVICHHVVTTFILPSLLHFLSYLTGLYWFYQGGMDELYGILEKVQNYMSSCSVTKKGLKFVIKKLETISIVGIALLIIVTINGVYINFNRTRTPFYYFLTRNVNIQKWNIYLDFAILIINFVGGLAINLVTALILIKFILYSDVLYYYCQAVLQQIMMRVISIKEVKNEMFNMHTLTLNLNRSMARVTTMILLMFIIIIIQYISVIVTCINLPRSEVIYHCVYFIVFFLVIILTVYQAIKVNEVVKELSLVPLHMNTFGYRNESSDEIHSFLVFSWANKFHVQLFGMPMRQKYFGFITIIFIIILVVLINLGILREL